jgi:hypothetical protein
MKKIFSLLILLSMVGAAVFAQEEAAEKAPPQLKISGSVDTGFYLGTTSSKKDTINDNDEDRLFYQNADGARTLDKLNFSLSDGEKFGVNLGWSIEGATPNTIDATVNGLRWGDNTFTANGWINFLEKKLKVTAGTDGLDLDVGNLPLAGLTAGVHFNFPGDGDGVPKRWTASEFFLETQLVAGYEMPDLFSASIDFTLDGSGDDSALYDDDWIRDLSNYNIVKGGVPASDPTAMKLGINFSFKAVKDLTADLDLTLWNLGSASGDIFKDNGDLNGGLIYKNAEVEKAAFNQKGLGAFKIHAKLGYALLGGNLGLSLEPTFVIYSGTYNEKLDWVIESTDTADVKDYKEKDNALQAAKYNPVLQLAPAVSYKLNETMTAGLTFTYRTKFDFYNRIAVNPTLSWKVLPNATIGLSFELANVSDGAAFTALNDTALVKSTTVGTPSKEYWVDRDTAPQYRASSITTTTTKITFGFTF